MQTGLTWQIQLYKNLSDKYFIATMQSSNGQEKV